VFPRIPAARRRPRRVHAVTALVAGVVGGLVAVLAALVLQGRDAAPGLATPVSTPQRSGGEPQEQVATGTVARVARTVLPSVVRINRASSDHVDTNGNGSGVVYRDDGLIVTSNHVVTKSGGVEVVFADGRTMPADIVGQDPFNDLAVIRVDRDGLDAIELGRTRQLEVGDLAVAVGSPFGLDATVTVGVVSALGRGVHAGAADGASVYLPEVIQTDAPINPGNSGGALVDRDGRLIGINSAILTAGEPANAGVGFAIPVDTVVDVADQLIADGKVAHPLLGVSGGPVSEHAAARLGVRDGAWVREVSPGTPASAAGLVPDDVIVALDDQPVSSMEDLSIAVRDREVGERVVVSFVRNGRRRTVEVVLAERTIDSSQ
jgi:S1-C subfamily serine protease